MTQINMGDLRLAKFATRAIITTLLSLCLELKIKYYINFPFIQIDIFKEFDGTILA